MEINIKIEAGKDTTKKVKKVLWMLVKTGDKELGNIAAINEVPVSGVLWREIDSIVKEMVTLRKKEIKTKK